MFTAIGKSPDQVMAAAVDAMAMLNTTDFFYSKANEPAQSTERKGYRENAVVTSYP